MSYVRNDMTLSQWRIYFVMELLDRIKSMSAWEAVALVFQLPPDALVCQPEAAARAYEPLVRSCSRWCQEIRH